MCTGLPCIGVPEGFTISKLIFQGRVHGHNTDDLVLEVTSPLGESGTLRMQMKRALTPTTKNRVFEEAIGLAWLDFCQATFRRGLDTSLIVYQLASAKSMEAAVEVVNMAISSSDSAAWEKKVHAEGFSNERNREAYAAIKTAAELYHKAPISQDELHQFVVHLRFIHHDLDSDSTNEVALQKQMLAWLNGPDADASSIWARLVHTCAELNGLGGDIDLGTVARHLGDQLSSQFHAFRAISQNRQSIQMGGLANATLEVPAAAVGVFLPPTATAQPPTPSYLDAVPAARPSSLNKLVSRQLDSISDLQREYRYSDALTQLKVLGQDMKDFDDHQRARWYLMRGMSRWHLDEDSAAAADDFLKAAALCDDEDKFVAARIRGHMLKGEITEALAAGQEALDRFPESLGVWVSATNARTLRGDRLTSAEIPSEHVNQASTWQMVAISQEQAGDLSGAIESAKTALQKKEASFFTKEVFLRLALQFATQNHLNVGFRMLPEPQQSMLQAAIAEFSDRSKFLWDVQSPKAQSVVLSHLGYAFLLIGKPQDALDLIDEARNHGLASGPNFARIEIESLRDLDRSKEAFARLDGALPQISDDALVAYGQTAVTANDLERLELAQAEAGRRTASPDAERLQQTFQVMRWDLLLRMGRSESVREELATAGITPLSNVITDLIFAVRAYRAPGGDDDLARQYIDRVAELSKEVFDPGEAYLAAQLLLQSKRYGLAAELYSRVLPASSFSDLHVDLLFCYLRTGQRSRARDLLQSMSLAWMKSADARHLAIDLCKSAGDWPAMIAISLEEIAANPDQAAGWLLRIMATANTEQSSLEAIIDEVPKQLSGSVRELVQLASAELRHGHVSKGLQRLYNTKRSHMGDVDAAALHIMPILLLDQKVKELDEEPEVVGPGTSVELTDQQGTKRRITIDPEGFDGLPTTEEFITPGSAEAQRLFGLHLNDTIEVAKAFGNSQTYTVTHLSSAHRRLVEISFNNLSSALSPVEHMIAAELPTLEDGSLDLSFALRQLERRREFATQTLDLYKQHPAPLGIIAQRLGCGVMELVRSWPHVGPKLEVGGGWQENHRDLQELLRSETVWVVDLSMLTELATLGHLEALKHLPRVLVSSATRNAIDCKLEETSAFRNSGTMFSHEGQIGFHEITKEDWLNERSFLQSITKAIEDYCVVMPSFGPEFVEPSLHRMNEILSGEEYSNLLLCLEHKASLLTLDARYGKIARLFEVNSVSVQELLYFMAEAKKIGSLEYSLAVLKMLFWRRTFVSIRVEELIAMVDQGGSWLTIGVNRLREYLSDPALNFDTAVPVVLGFIAYLYRRGNCELGVVLELIEYLVEPLLRHMVCRPEWIFIALNSLWNGLGFGPQEKSERFYVKQYLGRALERSQYPMREVAVRATVHFGTVIPSLISGLANDDDVASKEEVQSNKRRSAPEEVPATYAVEGVDPGTLEL